MEKTKKRRLQLLAASVFWLGVWQAAAMAIGQEVFLVSPVQALGTLVQDVYKRQRRSPVCWPIRPFRCT